MSGVGHIFRWDLDKTYLRTEFDSFSDLLRTARLTAEERENIPGSGALIRAIRNAAQKDSKNLIFFISGSPEQLRTVLEKKFMLDGFTPDGFVLKPTVGHVLRGRFRAVRSQVAYKLERLLRQRAEAPIGTYETLFGDDAEADAFVYSLYADVVGGRVPQDELTDVLKSSGAYRAQIDDIFDAMEAVVHEDPVRRIIVHLDRRSPPGGFSAFFPRVVPIYNHLQTALVLFLDGSVPGSCVRHVGRELLDVYHYDPDKLIRLAEDILRRRRSNFDAVDLDRLSDELAEVNDDDEPARRLAPEELDKSTDLFVAELRKRASLLRDIAAPKDEPAETKDYRKLWTAERERQDEAKRARKLAAKNSRAKQRRAESKIE